MANVLPLAPATAPPTEFVEALNGFIVGIVSLDFVQRSLAAALAADRRSAALMQALMDDAYQDGRLGAEEYEILSAEIGLPPGEDVPTEWADEVVNEAAPTSDMVPPGGGPTEGSAGAARPAALFPGAVLANRYVLQARLRTGGMSEVYKALDRRSQEAGDVNPWLAVKLANPAHRRFAEAVRLLEREAAFACELDHPHIVRVHGFERAGDHAFITMEWLDGEPLAELLTRQRYRPLTVARACQIVGEIGGALAFTHARGIAHADVKPGNIFLLRDGGAKLLDFGIARSAADAAEPAIAGAHTPAYASCEVLESLTPIPQDDVYSLAAVAYRMFAGRRVFSHQDALAAEAAGRRPSPIRCLSALQWAALERALSFRRAARTPDMATFLKDFNRTAPVARAAAPAPPARPAAPGRPAPPARSAPPARPAAPAPPARPARPAAIARPARVKKQSRPAKRRPWSAVAAVLIAAAAVAWLWSTGDAPDESIARTDTPAPELATPPVAAEVRTAPPDLTVPSKPPPKSKARAANSAGTDIVTEARRKRAPSSHVDSVAPPEGDIPIGSAALPAATRPPPAGSPLPDSPAQPAPVVPVAAVAASAPATPTEVPLSTLKFKRYVAPQDPRVRAEVPGWVELSFTVGTDGRTRDITIVGASPADRYEDITLDAVRRWRFEPALEDGRAVERRTDVRIRFQPK